MSNLLDALKNAGLADAKKAKKAEQAKKQQAHKELKSGASKAQAVSPMEAPEPQVSRQQAVENVAQQVRDRLTAAYRGAALTDISGRKKFYFTTLDQHIDCMMLSDVASALLDRGKYAIVANEAMDDYILVRRASALAIEAIDKKRIIVLRRQET
ncbi:MAG: DUF2058 family protein [Proteobacteria bacterium]|nr:DUF2058 family protein [Pseudomonadota bacterium]